MQQIAGNFYLTNYPGSEAEFPASIEKVGGKWTFSFSIPITTSAGRNTFHFSQGVSWNPVIGDYVFEPLPDKQCSIMGHKASEIKTSYKSGNITMNTYHSIDESYPYVAPQPYGHYYWTNKEW